MIGAINANNSLFFRNRCLDVLSGHNPPHVHVLYQGYEALIAIEDARVLRGRLPPTAMPLIRRWVTVRREELLANWTRARSHAPLERIAGPDDDDQG